MLTTQLDYNMCFVSQVVQIVSAESKADPRALAELHDILTVIETLHESGQFFGSVVRFFQIVEMCAGSRPVSILFFILTLSYMQMCFELF